MSGNTLKNTIPKGEALPCPFCGNSKLDLEEGGVDYHDDDHYESWIVVCKCGVKSPHEFYSQEQAIAFWNKRAPVYLVTLDRNMDGIDLLGVFSSPENARKKVLERWNQLPERDTSTCIEAFPFALDEDEGLFTDQHDKSIHAFKYTGKIRDNLGE